MHQDSFVEMQPATDLFGLEFAVSQWERLVSDAEGLFHKLIENGLPKESRTQIEQWLCLKQECSDCLVSDENTVNFPEKVTRSLERIDEVTEYEEVSTDDRSSTCDESDVPDEMDSQLESDSIVEDDTATCINSLSVVDNKMQDFEEKLEMFMQKFRLHTYEMVDNQFGTKHNQHLIENLEAMDSKSNVQKGAVNNCRSKSLILPAQLNNTCQQNTEQFVLDEDCRSYLPDKLNIQINTNKSDDFSNLHHFNYYEKNITEKYKSIALNYEKRLQDLEIIKQLAGDSAKKVADMENNLQNSKKRMQKLVRLLKRTEEHKYSLEKTIIEDQKRINELEEKCKLQFSKTKFMDLNQKPAKEEKENLRNDSQTYTDRSLKGSDKESLRQEIINLRKTREFLLEQRRSLDSKLNKDKVYTSAEERKFLELDEAVEAIDTAIEYKNEIICGHQALPGDNSEREKGEEMLIQRLMNLSEQEMRSLLYKYFRKVVDLRESGRRLEQQLADQDHQIEAQTWKIRALSNAVQQAHIENERRLVMVHREHDEKLHLMFRHYGGQVTSNGGETSTGSSSLDRDIEKVGSIDSQQPIIQLQGALPKAVPSKAITIPQQNLKKLQGSLSTHTTKVTRKKNKLIIQQHKAKHIS